MVAGAFPEELVSRFRTLSLERIGRVESVWNALLQGVDDEEAVRAISHDLHTLKGDAKIIGFDEVHALAQKLEELLALASHHDYRISEDFELVVSMATQFASMLLKKKSAAASGIDLVGFLRQVDDVLRETRVLRKTRPTNPGFAPLVETAADRLSSGTRGRLAIAATDAFLEYLSARQPHSRKRLHGIWRSLSAELSRLQIIELAPLVERQRGAATALAGELGKAIELVIDVGTTRLDPRVAEAVEMAMVHLVRNAIDHGIERPAERGSKPPAGRISIRAEESAGYIHVAIEDDGAGVDLEAVRKRAPEASERELLDVVFRPGFTTRADISDVSGRGVGLDAVKVGLTKVGGRVSIHSRTGLGTTITLVVPGPTRQLRVFQFLSPGGSINLAVSARWSPTVELATDAAIDPIQILELAAHSRQTITNIKLPLPEQRAVRLRWGLLEIPIKIATEPVLATAERVCPTPDEHPIEIITIDGIETLLLRPEHIKP